MPGGKGKASRTQAAAYGFLDNRAARNGHISDQGADL
jgi:hypothetical protein